MLADPDRSGQAMHLAVFAPAFTLSPDSYRDGESEAPASSIAIGTHVSIASVVMCKCKKRKRKDCELNYST